jgi:hypothetical protein
MRVMAFTMVALMTVLTTLRACQSARSSGALFAFEAKCRAIFGLENPS